MNQQAPTVSDLIYRCRQMRGLNMREAAERIGIDQSHYQKIESGKTISPGVENVRRILHGLGYTLRLSAVPHEQESGDEQTEKTGT